MEVVVGSAGTTRAHEPRSEGGEAQTTDGRFDKGSRPQPPRSRALAAARAAFGPPDHEGAFGSAKARRRRDPMPSRASSKFRRAFEFEGPKGLKLTKAALSESYRSNCKNARLGLKTSVSMRFSTKFSIDVGNFQGHTSGSHPPRRDIDPLSKCERRRERRESSP